MTMYWFGRSGEGWLPGQLYFPSLSVEEHVFDAVKTKAPRITRLYETQSSLNDQFFDVVVRCGDAGRLQGIPHDSIDYIFCDPPFGPTYIIPKSTGYMNVGWVERPIGSLKRSSIEKR